MSTAEPVEVIEFTDPCCSWAWGTEPKLRRLRWRYGQRVQWRTVLGGLVDDARPAYEGMTVAESAQRLSRYWSRVSEHTGAPYPVGLQWPPLTSHRMGQATRAAFRQSRPAGEALLRRCREAIFLVGRPPDTWERLAELAATVPDLDVERFVADLRDPVTAARYHTDLDETRRPNRHVRELSGDRPGIGTAKPAGDGVRYAFPTLVVRGPDGEATVPGWMDLDDYDAALETACHGITRDPTPPPTPAQALQRFGVVTGADIAALCGSEPPDLGDAAQLPDGAVAFDWGAGVVAVGEDVARAWRDAGWWPADDEAGDRDRAGAGAVS